MVTDPFKMDYSPAKIQCESEEGGQYLSRSDICVSGVVLRFGGCESS